MPSVVCEERFLNTLVEISSLITAGQDREMTFSKVLSCALSVLEAEAMFLITLEGGAVAKYAKRRGQDGSEGDMERHVHEGDKGIVGWVMREGRAMMIPRVGEEPRFEEATDALAGLGSRGCICAPLKAREAILGALVAVNKLESGSFSESDLSVLSVLANQTAIAIENASLYRSVQQLAVTDELTQVYNFRFLKTALGRELDRAARFHQNFSVLMLDVDNLKTYNDRFGHLKGSAVLKQLAGIVKVTARSIDLVAKYGGDEFLLILPQTPKEGALVLAERVRAAVAYQPFPEVSSGEITCSIGVSTYPEDGGTVSELLEAADTALYAAKQAGRNRVLSAVERDKNRGRRGVSGRA
ncbi:MAG: sensor domain-containing diguanylate cyclase [Candidatus Eisenbacteria bacterium]